MWRTPDSCRCLVRLMAAIAIPGALLLTPHVCTADTIALTKEGPRTAYEGDLIVYTLESLNIGTTIIEAAEVRDILPAAVDFVAATPTPGGVYDPVSGVWSLPDLGVDAASNSAGLRIEALVKANLVPDPAAFVTATNRAEVIVPVLPETIAAEVSTNIVCTFCIDWEIVSVRLDSDHRVEPPDPFQSRFFLYVQVANKGPVASEATVSVTHFSINGGGFGAIELTPALPVPVVLDAGESRTITFSTDWEDGPDSDYTIYWGFEVSDTTLIDPVMPNTVSGSWSGKVEGGGGGGGCSIDVQASMDPLWLLVLVLPGIRLARHKACRLSAAPGLERAAS
jgi:uncharacterized repeat protein (TIGR01451 family)